MPPPPQPPVQRTAAESAAAERAAKAKAKVRRAERPQRMLEEYERALDFELIHGSSAWRRLCDPSDDEGGPVPEACGAEPWDAEYKSEMGDEKGDKKGDDQATSDRPAATSSSSGWLSVYTLSSKYGSFAGDRGVKPGGIRPSTSSGDFVAGVHPWDLE